MTTIPTEDIRGNEAPQAVEAAIDNIARSLGYISDIAGDRAMRAANATQAGFTLADVVYRYVEDPEGVGTDALRKAWGMFMARHSGNFTDSAMAAS